MGVVSAEMLVRPSVKSIPYVDASRPSSWRENDAPLGITSQAMTRWLAARERAMARLRLMVWRRLPLAAVVPGGHFQPSADVAEAVYFHYEDLPAGIGPETLSIVTWAFAHRRAIRGSQT